MAEVWKIITRYPLSYRNSLTGTYRKESIPTLTCLSMRTLKKVLESSETNRGGSRNLDSTLYCRLVTGKNSPFHYKPSLSVCGNTLESFIIIRDIEGVGL